MSFTFTAFSAKVTKVLGSTAAFFIALGSIIVWALCGPMFHFSESWQLIINTATTIITFLMVFVIQHSQNKDTKALHAKLNELIRANKQASNDYRGIEELSEKEIDEIRLKELD